MSKNYDNWERLVRAVLRRESDKQLALSHSRDSSTISSPSSSFNLSFSSSFEFDHNHSAVPTKRSELELPMDYSDLTLDYSEWKTMLPPDKKETVWRSASLSFFLDQMTEKNCFMLGVRKILPESSPRIKNYSGSRFLEVARLEIGCVIDFEIESRINKQMLSPNSFYAAYLVFGLLSLMHEDVESAKAAGIIVIESTIAAANKRTDTKLHLHKQDLSKPENLGSGIATMRVVKDARKDLILRIQEKDSNQHRKVYLQAVENKNGHIAVRRDDGWMELKLEDFFVGKGDNRMVELLQLVSWRNELIVEGIEFRPNRKEMGKKGFFKF